MTHALPVKIIQGCDARHYRRERARNLRIVRICPMLLAIPQHVPVDRRVERLLHLPRSPGEIDDRAALGHFVHVEALRLEPRRYFLNILSRRAKLLPELFWCEP